eukprot:TRINITY_DN3737_c0_g1_i6.p1 TRINITY_DN3737_c0_g1~~TRINITY_DN3737_c0_g1_i6.p1  ORF type:complete len:114 (-),score=14.67 TRINITY_DN3737_c0_g1_i6:11-352(-)
MSSSILVLPFFTLFFLFFFFFFSFFSLLLSTDSKTSPSSALHPIKIIFHLSIFHSNYTLYTFILWGFLYNSLSHLHCSLFFSSMTGLLKLALSTLSRKDQKEGEQGTNHKQLK